ncbi:MAG: adenylosuccinate lyase, partial [candidate division WOR-3 bacterium]
MIERYSIPEIREIFSEERKYKRWIEIELAHLKILEEEGIVSKGSYNEVSQKVKDIDLKSFAKRAREFESQVDHDVIGFLMALEELVGEKGRFIHYGLTSSDIVDTANA